MGQVVRATTYGWRGHRMERVWVPECQEPETLGLLHERETNDLFKAPSLGSICHTGKIRSLIHTRGGKPCPGPGLATPASPPDPQHPLHQPLLTLASHSMPAREMASSMVTVTTPTMRMSLMGSTMGLPYSWGRGTSQAACCPLNNPPSRRLKLDAPHSLGALSQENTNSPTDPQSSYCGGLDNLPLKTIHGPERDFWE